MVLTVMFCRFTYPESLLLRLLMMLYQAVVSVFVLFFSIVRAQAQPQEEALNSIERLEYQMEIGRHQQLHQVALEHPDRLDDFTTDGCSGGLSVGWEYLAEKIPRFRKIHGEIPPWQGCCVDHDRAYYRGGQPVAADGSFFMRREADRKLMECVHSTGTDRREELSGAYGMTEKEVDGLYLVISRLMHRAVRIGGIPCTGLPWRWGYGWPECGLD